MSIPVLHMPKPTQFFAKIPLTNSIVQKAKKTSLNYLMPQKITEEKKNQRACTHLFVIHVKGYVKSRDGFSTWNMSNPQKKTKKNTP